VRPVEPGGWDHRTFRLGDDRWVFRTRMALDEATWARGRGWALWKALITLVEHRSGDTRKAEEARRVLGEVLGDSR
jgi:aminoglycoside phosphotransferase (APT) family kinase protein